MYRQQMSNFDSHIQMSLDENEFPRLYSGEQEEEQKFEFQFDK